MKRKNFPERKAAKRIDAQTRREERANRSPQEQLELVNQRLGDGVGATKERAKLAKLMETADAPATSTTSAAVSTDQGSEESTSNPQG